MRVKTISGALVSVFCFAINTYVVAQNKKYTKAKQPVQQIVDNQLARLLDKMNYWANDFAKNYEQSDSLVAARERVTQYVEYVNTHYAPELINELPKCSTKGVHYVRSDDKKVNIISWKERTEDWGRPIVHRQALAGLVTDSGLRSYDILNSVNGDWFYKDLFAIKVADSKCIYVATFFAEYRQMADAFEIEGTGMTNIPFFETEKTTEKRLKANFAVADDEHTSGWPVMKMNAARTKLYVPNGNPDTTKRYWVYNLNNEKLVLDNKK